MVPEGVVGVLGVRGPEYPLIMELGDMFGVYVLPGVVVGVGVEELGIIDDEDDGCFGSIRGGGVEATLLDLDFVVDGVGGRGDVIEASSSSSICCSFKINFNFWM